MSHCQNHQHTPELVFQQLDSLFLDPTLQAKALDWLNRTRQMDVMLATYLPEFDRKLLEAGGQDWDDTVKINMLFKNLNFQLHNQSIEHPKPSTYSKFCTDLRLLDNDLSQFRALQNHRGFC
ncbi:retrovirus polyprotein [Histoplasma ohiense]|nr:retrovirus polyprotein [Histoplasma ohiense (nom. inval.)]